MHSARTSLKFICDCATGQRMMNEHDSGVRAGGVAAAAPAALWGRYAGGGAATIAGHGMELVVRDMRKKRCWGLVPKLTTIQREVACEHGVANWSALTRRLDGRHM